MLTDVAPRCLAITDISNEAVGGKAKGLAELEAMGLPVPPAFVIQQARADVFPDDLAARYQSIGGGKVAVRSSAIGEDGEQASFAGQYETILNVEGLEALKVAIAQCVASLGSARATAYQGDHAELEDIPMCVVVQRMVDAQCAGVLFSVDPVTGRHDRLIVDAIAGLGEALISGEATPDHFVFNRNGEQVVRELVLDEPVVSEDALAALVQSAREAEQNFGQPLDMEWAIDRSGELFWLQARPITTLSSDLNGLDTPIPQDQVITRCNVGEMMPGVVCPLTFSVQGRAIEHGMQHMHVSWGARPAITRDWTQINLFYGHMFINLTGGLASATHVSINTPDTIAQSLCGRPIPELTAPEKKAPVWIRLYLDFGLIF